LKLTVDRENLGRLLPVLLASLAMLMAHAPARANNYDTYFLPDMFSIDRTPVSCGTAIFVLDKSLPEAGVNKGDGHIVLNPDILDSMPSVLKLYVAAHECAYSIVGRKDEAKAACWAVRSGRDQGWFSPKGFELLLKLLQKPDPGWPPAIDAGAAAALQKCYAS
jgi:hypothetical protein